MVRTAQLENDVFLLVFVVCLFPFGETDATLDLTPQPPYCPGPVIFTCVGTEITSSLFWIVNGSEVAAYGYSSRVDLPVDLDIDPPLDGVTAVVTEVDRITNTLFNITSIFNVSDVTVLNGASLQCGDSNNASHPLIISMNIPPPANRLLHLPGSLKISLQWSPSFTSQYTAVDKYRVSVNPDPSSCSSDQVSPSEDYSCSGLVLGTRYTFTVSAINCGDQEGERESFTVNIAMKVLGIPTIIAVTREGNQIRVEWQKVLFPLDTNKTLNIDTNYSVVISDSEGNELYQTDVNSDVCNNEGLCTTSFIPDDYSLEQYNMITVTVRASNVFGESNSTEISVTCVRLTNINTVLLSLGVVLSCIALLGCVILIFLRIKNGYSMWVLILVIVGCVVLVISIVLWVAVAGLQDNTCDSDWQFSRDGLIISAFVLSATAMVVIVATLLVAVWAFKKKRKDKYEAETVETPGPVFSLEDTSQNNAEEENEAQQEKSQALKVKFGAIKPAFEPDDLHECQDCGHKLYGFWWPGYEHHHCYACGKLVCAPCSKYKAYLEYCTKECRVCENCFKEYSEQQQPAQDTKLKDSSPVPDQELRSTSRDSKNYSEFEVMPTEGNYDATSHLGEVFQSKSVVNSVQVDPQNYCEIELDLYDTTCRQRDTTDKFGKGFGRTQQMEFDPYSELDLSSTPASLTYDAINRQKPSGEVLTSTAAPCACNDYSELPASVGENYDTISHKGETAILHKPDILVGEFSEAYSEIAVRSTEEYNTTTHLKPSSSVPYLPDEYSDIGIPLSCHNYDTTTHNQVIKKERAKISTVTCSQEYCSGIDALSSDQNGRKKTPHHDTLPKPVKTVRKPNFEKELEKALSKNGVGPDTSC